MRKEVVNTFSDGMIMDLNPLTTPNNVLVNCLNGTLVTYNGNEFVLQNDMGNGKVETALLPAGYVPLGVKEYGGIIYVVSYNPASKKGQIGSFPSPERNFTNEEKGAATQAFNSVDFFDTFDKVLKSSYKKYDLLGVDNDGEEVKLNPGDKFGIIFEGSYDISTLISDSTTKRLFKIRVGILDNDNNLTYISDSLEKVDGEFWAFPNSGDTSSANNIFKNKTSGKLIITAELETLEEFSCTVNSSLEGGMYINEITYDCDEASKDILRGIKVDVSSNIDSTKSGYFAVSDGKTFTITSNAPTNGQAYEKLSYKVTPYSSYGLLEALTRKGTIDTQYIYSGMMNLSEWRYYVDTENDEINIAWGIEYYPKKGFSISNVTFKLFDLAQEVASASELSSTSLQVSPRSSYNGNFLDTFALNDDLLQDKLYFVAINIEELDSLGNRTVKPFYRFLYTSTIFNSLFFNGVDDYSTKQPEIDVTLSVNPIENNTVYGASVNTGDVMGIDFSSEKAEFKELTYRDSDTTIKAELKAESSDSMFEVNSTQFNSYSPNATLDPNNTIISDVTNKYVNGEYSGATEFKAQTGKIISSAYNSASSDFGYTITQSLSNGILTVDLKLRSVSEVIADTTDLITTKEVNSLTPYFNSKYFDKIFGFEPRVGELNKFWTYKAWSVENRDSGSGHHSEYWVRLSDLADSANNDENEALNCLKNVTKTSWPYSEFDTVKNFYQINMKFVPPVLFFTSYRDSWLSRLIGDNIIDPTNYAFMQWKTSSGGYVTFDKKFKKNVTTGETSVVDYINNLFSKLYAFQTDSLDISSIVPNNISYNGSYKIKSSIKLEPVGAEVIEPTYKLKGSTKNLSQSGLETVILQCMSNNESKEVTNVSGISVLNITPVTSSVVKKNTTLEIEINSPSVNDVVSKYSNPVSSISQNNVYIDGNGKLQLTDGYGKSWDSSKVYYIDANSKIRPLEGDNAVVNGITVRPVFKVSKNSTTDFNEIVVDTALITGSDGSSLYRASSLNIGEDFSRKTTIPTKRIIWTA